MFTTEFSQLITWLRCDYEQQWLQQQTHSVSDNMENINQLNLDKILKPSGEWELLNFKTEIKSWIFVPEIIRPIEFNNANTVPRAREKLKHLVHVFKVYKDLTRKAERIVWVISPWYFLFGMCFFFCFFNYCRKHPQAILRSYFHLPYQFTITTADDA